MVELGPFSDLGILAQYLRDHLSLAHEILQAVWSNI